MHGIKVNDELTVCHRIFVDDVGIFIPVMEAMFIEARNALAVYKRATGASLNLKKSVVIPFGVSDFPLWLVNLGCVISLPGTVQRYLGAPWGTGLDEAHLLDFYLEWMAVRLSAWSSRTLSFIGRTLLIFHVLHDIPIYQMMFIYLPKAT